MSDARQLAKACGAAQRAYQPVADMARITSELPLQIARQGNVVLEELDLLRHFLREATLCSVIGDPVSDRGPLTADRQRASDGRERARSASAHPPANSPAKAKGSHARAAKLSATRRKAIARKAAQARWNK